MVVNQQVETNVKMEDSTKNETIGIKPNPFAANKQIGVSTIKEEIDKNEVIDVKSKPLAVADDNQLEVNITIKEDGAKNEVIDVKPKSLATENQREVIKVITKEEIDEKNVTDIQSSKPLVDNQPKVTIAKENVGGKNETIKLKSTPLAVAVIDQPQETIIQ